MTWEIRDRGWPIPYNTYKPVFKKLVDQGWPVTYNNNLYKPYMPLPTYHSELYKGQMINTWV